MSVGEQWWWWFSLGRDQGGPTYYPGHHGEFPAFFWYLSLIAALLVLFTPILIFVILLPSFRKKQWPSVLVVLLCLLTGTYFLVVLGSSSWLVGEAGVRVSVGPRGAPTQGQIGLGAGLYHANLTYRTRHLALNEAVEWTTSDYLTSAHRTALKKGWPWALVALTAELGEEWPHWQGSLGRGLRVAGLAAYICLVAAVYVWVVWVLLFAVAPGLTPTPLMLSGALLNFCSLSYALCLSVYAPAQVMVAGQYMKLHLGYAWWLTTLFGTGLTLTGIFLCVYDMKYPGHLTKILNMDFYSNYETDKALSQRSERWFEPLTAYTRMQETYSQGHVSSPPERDHLSSEAARYVAKNIIVRDASAGATLATCGEVKENHERDENFIITTDVSFISEKDKEAEISRSVPEDASTPVVNDTTLSPSQTHTFLSTLPNGCRRRTPEERRTPARLSALGQPFVLEQPVLSNPHHSDRKRPKLLTLSDKKVHSKLKLPTPTLLSRKSPLRAKRLSFAMLLSQQERGELKCSKKLSLEVEEFKTNL